MTDSLVSCYIKWIAMEPADEDGVIWRSDDPRRGELELNMAMEDMESILAKTQKRLSPILLGTEREDLGLEGVEIAGIDGPEQVAFIPYQLLGVSGYGLLIKHTNLVFRLPHLSDATLNDDKKREELFSELTAMITFEIEHAEWVFVEAGREDEYCELTDTIPEHYTTVIN